MAYEAAKEHLKVKATYMHTKFLSELDIEGLRERVGDSVGKVKREREVYEKADVNRVRVRVRVDVRQSKRSREGCNRGRRGGKRKIK